MPVSETEKCGVSTLGCRRSNKAEHVPIKKRRFLLRSPSPPPVRLSPCTEETPDHTGSHDVSNKFVTLQSSSDINVSQVVEDNNINDGKKSDISSKSFGEDEDFSGISILAAAACSSSLGRDCGYAEDGSGIEDSSLLERAREVSTYTEVRTSLKGLSKDDIFNSSEMSSGASSSCISTEPIGELVSISTTVNSSHKVATVAKMKDVSCSKDEDVIRNQRTSSRDVRLHWDLNVVMDAWEQPFDDPGVQNDVAHNICQDAGNVNHNENMGSEVRDLRENLETVYAVKSEQKASTNQSLAEIKDSHGIDACLNLKQPLCLGEKSLPSNSNLNLDVMKCMVEDTKCRHHKETVNPTSGLVIAAPDSTTQPSTSCTINEASDSSVKNLHLNDKHIGYQPVMEGFKSYVGVSTFQLQNVGDTCASDATFRAVSADTCISLCASPSSKLKQNVAVPEDPATPKIFSLEEKALVENVDLKTMEPQQHAEFAISDINGLSHTEAPNSVSNRCELLVDLETNVQDVSNIQDGNVVSNNEIIKNVSENSPLTLKDSRDFYETCKTNLNSSKYSDIIGADVQCYPVLEVETDATGELQEGYDSQYEDGELRESSGRAWEDDNAVARGAGNEDYMLKYRETYMANPGDDYIFESGLVVDRECGRLGIAAAVSSCDCSNDNEVIRVAFEAAGNESGHVRGNQIKSSHVGETTELTLGKELLERNKSFSDMAIRDADDVGRNCKMLSHIEKPLDSQGTEARAEPKAFRRGLQSQIESPTARDHAYREGQFRKMENRFEPGSMRSFERVRYPLHNQGRGRQGGRWDGSSDNRRGFRRHYSPINHGHSKLDDANVERDDHGCVGSQDDVSYFQLLPKNRSGTDGEPCAGFHSRYKTDRKFSPDRAGGFGRGRPFRYGPYSESRGGRGRFNGPSPDESFQSSLKYRRPISRRERSISPFGGRGQSNIHHSRRKSPSRSRSRSPIIWNSPRRRMGAGSSGNNFFRQRSKSPSFRPEARMQRLRSPQQQPGFGVDHAGGFRSISRNHGSPPRNRWSSVRKDEPGHFRELGYKQRTFAQDRSPARTRLRDDRGNNIDSPRNLKPDGYYRMSDRISDDAGRVRYEENFEERRKQYNNRPGRRSFDDGMASRLHQDINDSFPMANSFRDRDASSFLDRGLRNIDSRIGDGPRRFRGENHSIIYERDGKFNLNSKQFGVDAVDSSHNLKSEEQYRPNYGGRFSDNNVANRGCRYEEYEDRRKHYGQTNKMRRSDNEDTEKRLNHDATLEDTPEFGSRVTRGCDGGTGSLSTSFREDEEPVVCVQEEKLDDNSLSVSMQNSGDDDATKGVVPS